MSDVQILRVKNTNQDNLSVTLVYEPCKQTVALRHTYDVLCMLRVVRHVATEHIRQLRMAHVHKAELCARSSKVAHDVMIRAQCYN